MPKIPIGDDAGAERFGRDERFESDERLIFAAEPTLEVIEWWTHRFGAPYGLYPREMADFLAKDMPGNVLCKYTKIDHESGFVSLEISGIDGGVQVWFTGQSIILQEQSLYNDLTHIVEQQQGRGLGKILMANCFELADMLGLEQMELLAAMEAGPYAWARFGFRPDPDEWQWDVKSFVTQKLEAIRKSLPSNVAMEVESLLKSDDPATILELAKQEFPVDSIQYKDDAGIPLKIPLGRALLAESGLRWHGKLDLTDDDAVAIFLEYVGRS